MNKLVSMTLACALAGTAHAAGGAARAQLKDASGKDVGTAAFSAGSGMVKMDLKVRGLAPGAHGLHVHEKGACEAPDFKSAGGHFNPHGKKHGLQSDAGAHAGDLPNLLVGADASLTLALAGVTLDKGEKNSLLDGDGSALVIHAGPDDGKTDPAGDSGARVACGVIQAP
jgi:superoxide dismutase, Cu-Zn family